MKWVKIEGGCEMPVNGEKGLIVIIDLHWRKSTYLADYEHDQFVSVADANQSLHRAIWVFGGEITHWARVELPEE